MAIISEQGFPGLSMRAIAKRAGLSPGTLTYHFAGKADLVSGCLDQFVEAEFSRIMTLAQEVDDPLLALEIGVRSQVEISLYPICRKFDFAYWAHAETDPQARQHMDKMAVQLRENTAHLIRAAHPGRSFDVAVRQAAVIQAMIEGMAVAMPLDESRSADLGLQDFYEDTVQACLGIAASDTWPA
jgi:AcrR family transcriptional regulator